MSAPEYTLSERYGKDYSIGERFGRGDSAFDLYFMLDGGLDSEGIWEGIGVGGGYPVEALAEMERNGWLEVRPSGPQGEKRWHTTAIGAALVRYALDDLTTAERELHAAWAEEFGKPASAQEWGVALTARAENPAMPLAWIVAAAKASCAA
jgi:hypothetical protein